ncbi:efflux RND transporter periplasmic adaptor subunit [Baaleninema sp.]|uniref:efflux RND transporter periplasmic adaptor subunit n=1 Tax=Baaleninema sp. TaxID=3101197 RepID=UPI003D048C95
MSTQFPEPTISTEDRSSNTSSPEESSSSPFDRDPSPKPPRWGLIVIAIVILAGGGGYFGWQWWQSRQSGQSEQASGPRPAPVELDTVETASVEDSSEFVGTLEAQQTATLRAETDGEIVEIYVRPGDTVGQGEILAQLDSRSVEADIAQNQADVRRAQAELAELQAGTREEQIAQARARLRQAEADLRNAQSGASPAEIAQARSRLESARATANLASDRLDRYRLLESRGAVSTDELDQRQEDYQTAMASLREAQDALEELQAGQDVDIDRLSALVEQRRQELRELENGARIEEIDRARADVEMAQADLEAARVRLQDTAVIAPFTGTIGDIPVKVGDYLNRGDVFATLTQNQTMELRLSIPLERSDELRLGLPVEVFDAAGSSTPLALGRVSFISPQVNQDSQTVLVKVTFENTDGKLRDRQFVRARVIWRERPGTVVIPTTAIVFQGQRRFVFVAQGSGENLTAKRQPVELGISQGDRTEVIEGVQPGDRIIVSGLQKLADGRPIMPVGGEMGR